MSRRRPPLRLPSQRIPEPVEESPVAVVAAEAADGSVEDTLPRHRAFAALLEIARRPLVDEPARRGGVDMHDDDPERIPERIDADESPLDLARRTQARRERVRRESTPPADGIYALPGGRRRVVQHSLAASAVGELRRRFPIEDAC
jgi:hypothetical protein